MDLTLATSCIGRLKPVEAEVRVVAALLLGIEEREPGFVGQF